MLVLLMDMADSPGDKIKVEALYNEYDRLMYYIAGKILNNHEDIEDAVMEAWIRIIRNLDKISEISCPKTMSYVVVIVERVAINIYKKNSSKNNREVMVENFEESPIFATSDQEMSSIEVHQILRNMPKKYSDPLILYYIQELSVEEISKLLDVSTDAVYKRIQRGRKEFSNLLIVQAETIGNGHVLKAINNPKSKVECSITNTGTAKVSAVVKTVFCSTTKMTLYFQKYSKSKKKWTTIKTCTKTSSQATTILERTYELSKKGTYRVKMTAVVTRNEKKETIRMISNNAKF